MAACAITAFPLFLEQLSVEEALSETLIARGYITNALGLELEELRLAVSVAVWLTFDYFELHQRGFRHALDWAAVFPTSLVMTLWAEH